MSKQKYSMDEIVNYMIDYDDDIDLGGNFASENEMDSVIGNMKLNQLSKIQMSQMLRELLRELHMLQLLQRHHLKVIMMIQLLLRMNNMILFNFPYQLVMLVA